jgi:hypothetical protein
MGPVASEVDAPDVAISTSSTEHLQEVCAQSKNPALEVRGPWQMASRELCRQASVPLTVAGMAMGAVGACGAWHGHAMFAHQHTFCAPAARWCLDGLFLSAIGCMAMLPMCSRFFDVLLLGMCATGTFIMHF